MICPCCNGKSINDLDNTFTAKTARRDARRYLSRGLDRRAQKLVAAIQPSANDLHSMLEIGGGAGGLHQELLRSGVVDIVDAVEAASAYVQQAQKNAAQLGLSERIQFHNLDFAQSSDQFESADLVIMDRVICCYPYLQALLGAAAKRTGKVLAISYPIDHWLTRLIMTALDGALRLTRSGYHPFIHSEAMILQTTAAAGLRPLVVTRHQFWRIRTFART